MWHCDARHEEKRKIKIKDEKLLRTEVTFEGVIRRFVVCAPKFDEDSLSPLGRSTRRSLALDFDSPDLHDPDRPRGGLLFMNDYWHDESPGTAKESDIYHLFAQHRVPHVAEMETGGDIPDMVTITQGYGPVDLTTFCNVKDLVKCIADAIEAHQPAFDRAHILHCDIRAGHIMITLNHAGFLIESDECIILTDRSEGTSDGSAKIDLLNRYSARPCFAIQHLNELLRKLPDVFVIRYQPKRTTEEIQTHETWTISYPDRATELPAPPYFTKMGKLENPTWLVETLHAHAEKMTGTAVEKAANTIRRRWPVLIKSGGKAWALRSIDEAMEE
ncbi:uncharacterized protein BT62DRAFT_1079279 [Guyanagaster necrorhizus]|uniref:Fungal-type protein kinase domain-containing protein n=1 Tax=Guyanagaster necrorhizus TaxID=856835 RepID=A0A9P7VJS6_9AGAR|nr:uncharacterized protein BT62DRAFT_1079279 [Guyanagaster necrorhizus MCA 3950]KAG7442423.1 hypothetical protein BT62DRAFT_1079279 [Guyanagaster necrorhizus MCA 3950]